MGYITASTGYVTAAYYRAAPRQITVIDPAGIDAHAQPHLTAANPVTHYAQGASSRWSPSSTATSRRACSSPMALT